MKTKITLISFVILSCGVFAQITPAWINMYNGPTDGSDVASAIAVDISGDIYVSGTGFTTIKYSPSGTQKWLRTYGNGYANCMATDASGNVYVAGAFSDSNTGNNFATIKFDSAGNTKWVSKFIDPGAYDEVKTIALDKDGNVYAAGAVGGTFSGMWRDYMTIKISPLGDTLWTRRFGSANAYEIATAIAVSDSGYVYVTGYYDAYYGHGRFNYGTFKYAPNGDLVWFRYYDGTASDDDVPSAIAVDKYGSVYVTGKSWGNWYDDYATVKYNAGGTQQWVARYNGPVNSYDKASALKLDDAGNVYITGASGGLGVNYDYATIKYNNSGVQQWVARYNGPANQDDFATSLTLDKFGNVFVTGYSDNAPAPYRKSSDYATVMYNSAGIEQWSGRYNGPGNYADQAFAIATDNSGNAYVTGRAGYYVEQGNFYDYATLRYNAGYRNKVLTDSVSKVEYTSAVVWGDVNTGGLPVAERGVVYSLSDLNPKLKTGTAAVGGSGEGTFSVSLDNLAANKNYFVRAYAISQQDTLYGAVLSFKTKTIVIVIQSEGSGIINKLSGETNHNGGMVWNGSEWIVNNTWAHKYFIKSNTGQRLKPVNVVSIPVYGKDTVFYNSNYQVHEHIYSYTYPAKNGGSYSYSATGYLVSDTITKKNFVLRSRGTGNGVEHSYFDIFIEDERSAGIQGQITAIRTDPKWFRYIGMTMEEALMQTSPTDSLTGEFPSLSGSYFLDFEGGGDLGPAGIGKSYIFHTSTMAAENANTADLGSSYPSDFALRWMDGKGDIYEMDFMPGLLSETFVTDIGENTDLPDKVIIFPNPFTQTTTIAWQQPNDCHVVLKVYDFTGRELKNLIDCDQAKGKYEVTFDATGLPAGVYFCQLRANGVFYTNKMIVCE